MIIIFNDDHFHEPLQQSYCTLMILSWMLELMIHYSLLLKIDAIFKITINHGSPFDKVKSVYEEKHSKTVTLACTNKSYNSKRAV